MNDDLIVFDHDDAGYLACRDGPPPMFVANEDKSGVIKLHRADCRFLAHMPKGGAGWTHAYPKACSPHLADLIARASGRGKTARSCRLCNPFRVRRL